MPFAANTLRVVAYGRHWRRHWRRAGEGGEEDARHPRIPCRVPSGVEPVRRRGIGYPNARAYTPRACAVRSSTPRTELDWEITLLPCCCPTPTFAPPSTPRALAPFFLEPREQPARRGASAGGLRCRQWRAPLQRVRRTAHARTRALPCTRPHHRVAHAVLCVPPTAPWPCASLCGATWPCS